jgi:hypothetical protein
VTWPTIVATLTLIFAAGSAVRAAQDVPPSTQPTDPATEMPVAVTGQS